MYLYIFKDKWPNYYSHQPTTMQYICTVYVMLALVVGTKGSNVTQQEEEKMLMKNISNLHFQLFSSIQKNTKIIKVKKTINYHFKRISPRKLVMFVNMFSPSDCCLWDSVQWIGVYIQWMRVERFRHMRWTNDSKVK